MSLVCYHLPSDRDDPEHPNVYQINKPVEDVTLQDIKNNFPLPGNYHFRFKAGESHSPYWIDVTDMNKVVPSFGPRRTIVAKVLRLSWQTEKQPTVVTAVAPPPRSSPPPPAKVSIGELDLFG